MKGATAIFCLILPGVALASPKTAKPSLFETSTVLFIGGPIGLLGDVPKVKDISTVPGVGGVAQRFGLRNCMTPRLELSFIPPWGFGLNLLVDVWKSDRLRIHLLDPGIFLTTYKPLSVNRFSRVYDITFGGGIEVRIGKKIWLGLNWRAYMPDPAKAVTELGEFVRPIVNEVLQGGMTWLEVSYSWL